ncbi:MAG: thiamine pyrophosphate-dependent enzyme [Proteobacteria bacterium]|nr:thiamine pyrophosphate-dependent enzyme [Pseudomonadota bacterium]
MSTNRAEIVDANFTARVREGRLPVSSLAQPLSLAEAGLTAAAACDLFESQVLSRHLDFSARLLKARSESFYTIGSSGHEGNAVLGKVFKRSDMAFLHYRSGALFIQRQKQLPGSTPVWDMLLSLVASAEDQISGGRHKVFGSLPLLVPPQTSTIASHLPKAVGMALSIRRAKDLNLAATVPSDSIVLCNFGDASANHASALSAFNAASWAAFQGVPVPIVFICEDNGIGISVSTPSGWIQSVAKGRPMLRYTQCDGLNLADAYRGAAEAVAFTRRTRQPSFLHMRTVRLLGHAGSDVEGQYHPTQRIEAAEADDPLLHSAALLLAEGVLSGDEILNLYESVRQRVARAAEHAILRPKLLTAAEVAYSVLPHRQGVQIPTAAPLPTAAQREQLFGSDWRYLEKPQHLAKLINWALADILLRYQNTVVFGEDVAQKGGVYNVTTGLYQKFGARRVFNSLLDETSILGTAIGMAHNGFIPIPEIQFLAYVHNAEDQLRGEAATLSFFSGGRFTNPMVVRIAGLAYQKGFGGHFHNDNSLAVFRDLPGVIIACPSNGADAAMMLRSAVRAAHEQGRVVIFIEPIALYMTKDLDAPGDGGWLFPYPSPELEIAVGQCAVHGDSDQLAIITYGNGVYLSRQAALALAKDYGLHVKIIDLRWLAPLDEDGIAAAVKGAKAVLIVDECRRTGSQSEALITLLVERLEPLPKLRRLTADDCFIPLGLAATVTLPSKESIIAAALALTTKTPATPVRT